jgi:dipeptidyl aminopeptidase/acylaminoacyl peptidase
MVKPGWYERSPHASACLFVAYAWLLVSASPATAQRSMTLVDILNVPGVSDPQLSPDGRQVLYVLSEADWKANKRTGHIWRVNVDGSATSRLTEGADGESSPRWSPDGNTVAFLAKRGDDEVTQMYLLSVNGGEGRRLTRHATRVSNIAWTPDSSSVYFLAAEAKTDEQKARERAQDDVYAFEEDYKQQHLWSVRVANTVEQRITTGDFSIRDYALSRDGTRVACHRAPNPLLGSSDQSEVWVMGADGSGAVQITQNQVAESSARLSPDGSQVLFISGSNQQFEKYFTPRAFVVSVSGGAARIVGSDLSHDIESAEWSSDGRSIFVVANMGVHSQLLEVDLANGRPRQLTTGNHTLRSWSYVPAAALHLFAVDEPTNRGDLWTLSASGGRPTRVTKVYEYLARDFRHPRQEKVEWKGADGTTVEGMLFYPLDYRTGERYPLVVQTHGGPQTSDKYGFGQWRTYVQVLAAHGYVVLQPNYRGSTGYGDAFLRDMVGGYFKQSHLDVIAGVDHLIKIGLVDQDRIVKMGWSAGGHMTNKIITFTDRFKAASSGAGAANWVSMYAQSDVRTNRTPWFGGTPWQEDAPIDIYWENSPLKDVASVTTPTIFLVGERDERVPSPQAVEMYRALKSNGVPTHLYIGPREPHGWSELRHQLFKMNVELDWFERHAMGREYRWETPPGDTTLTTPTEEQRK